LLGREGGVLRLALDPRQASARTKAREEKLSQALSRQLGEAVRIDIEVRAAAIETPAQAADRANHESIAAAHEQLLADPVVQSIQQRFGATIHPDSVRPLEPR
jgi:DNA polymerase-3 subunit gamma/tau